MGKSETGDNPKSGFGAVPETVQQEPPELTPDEIRARNDFRDVSNYLRDHITNKKNSVLPNNFTYLLTDNRDKLRSALEFNPQLAENLKKAYAEYAKASAEINQALRALKPGSENAEETKQPELTPDHIGAENSFLGVGDYLTKHIPIVKDSVRPEAFFDLIKENNKDNFTSTLELNPQLAENLKKAYAEYAKASTAIKDAMVALLTGSNEVAKRAIQAEIEVM